MSDLPANRPDSKVNTSEVDFALMDRLVEEHPDLNDEQILKNLSATCQ